MTDSSETNRLLCEKALKCWFLTGATAGGKTRVSVELARNLDAEIISMDSMTIYREMDIGTAKPTIEQRGGVPHHLIDLIDPIESFSVSQFRDAALAKIDDIRSRGKEVLFVGGTALYLKAMLRGIFEGPPADWEFRKAVEQEIESVGIEALHARLQQVDPLSAHKLHSHDQRRIIRALEVYKTTGRPISHLQQEFETETPAEQCRVFALRHRREVLHERIERRVEQMFEEGLVDEVRQLLDRWKELSRTAAQAVGYQEVIEFLDGKLEHADAVEKIKVRTRRFARHQETWFRGLTECRLIDLTPDQTQSDVVEALLGASRETDSASSG